MVTESTGNRKCCPDQCRTIFKCVYKSFAWLMFMASKHFFLPCSKKASHNLMMCSWIARRVTSRRYPEATVMETYRVSCIGNWNWGLSRWYQVLDFIITSVREICSIQNWCNECLLLRFMSGAITWKYLGGCLMSSHIVLNVVEEVLFTYWFWADSRYTSCISLWAAYQRQPVLHYF